MCPSSGKLEQRVASLKGRITPEFVRAEVEALLGEGQDIGGGINAVRLIQRWASDLARSDARLMWAYDRLKPQLRAALEEVPSLHFFEGD
jgi:hypothetical protein